MLVPLAAELQVAMAVVVNVKEETAIAFYVHFEFVPFWRPCCQTVLADADHCQAVWVKSVRHADPLKPKPASLHFYCHFTRLPPSTGRKTLLKTKYFGHPTRL